MYTLPQPTLKSLSNPVQHNPAHSSSSPRPSLCISRAPTNYLSYIRRHACLLAFPAPNALSQASEKDPTHRIQKDNQECNEAPNIRIGIIRTCKSNQIRKNETASPPLFLPFLSNPPGASYKNAPDAFLTSKSLSSSGSHSSVSTRLSACPCDPLGPRPGLSPLSGDGLLVTRHSSSV